MNRPYVPEFRRIPLTQFGCEFRRSMMVSPHGHPIFVSEPVCGHRNGPWVEFPKGSGFRDPYYCRTACESEKCPLGFARIDQL
jgi:hypothetical protein